MLASPYLRFFLGSTAGAGAEAGGADSFICMGFEGGIGDVTGVAGFSEEGGVNTGGDCSVSITTSCTGWGYGVGLVVHSGELGQELRGEIGGVGGMGGRSAGVSFRT